MSFTIIRNFEQLPSYPMLCKLAGQNMVRVVGNEQIGSFSCDGVEGEYEFSQDAMRGRFVAHRVSGEFSFATGKATVTVIEKPFWLPENLLKQKIAEGLDTLSQELAKEAKT
jgi:hypothetical protein